MLAKYLGIVCPGRGWISRATLALTLLGLQQWVLADTAEDIAALKRRTQALEQHLRRQSKVTTKAAPPDENEMPSSTHRFSAKGLAS